MCMCVGGQEGGDIPEERGREGWDSSGIEERRGWRNDGVRRWRLVEGIGATVSLITRFLELRMKS